MSTQKNPKKFLLLASYDEYALGLRLLASLLLEMGHDVRLVMFKKFSLGVRRPPTEKEWELLERTLADYAPDFVGISLLSIPVIDEPRLFRTAREACPGAVVVCGGFGPTLENRRFLDYGCDYIVCGEGEGAMVDMARALEKGENFRAIPNLAWLENGEVVKNPLRPLADLAGLPFALHGDSHILCIEEDDVRRVDPMLQERGMYLTSTSRGCTGRCTYCAGGNWLGLYREEHPSCSRYRARPTEEVLLECERAKKLGASYLFFLDEYFIRPEKEYFAFFTAYKERVGIPFGLMVHTAFLEKDEARFRVFWEAGVHDIEIGVQSASPHIARDIFHRSVDAGCQMRAIRKMHDHWVSTSVDFITGHHLESEEDFRCTLDFVRDLPFDIAWPERTHIQAFYLALLPGAKIGELYPELREDPMPAAEKEFRQRSLYLRHILKDDEEFFAVYRNPFFREHPGALKTVFQRVFARLTTEFWQRTLQRLEGRDIYFYGAGQQYQTFKHMFRQCRPRAILLDGTPAQASLDGLPVLPTDEALAQGDPCPVILFSATPGKMATHILRGRPEFSDLIPCYATVYPQLFLS